MNILIIGNGFDIAHGLPTTYVDFIKFMDMIDFIRTSDLSVSEFIAQKDNLESFKSLKENVAKYFVEKIDYSSDLDCKISTYFLPKPYINELLQLSYDNVWIKYFSKNYNHEKNTWAGFESDISKIVQEFEEIRTIINVYAEGNTGSFSKTSRDFLSCLYGNTFINEHHIVGIQWYRNIKNKMINDLNSLIRCFEIYLEDCVRNIKIPELSLDILEAEIEKVLSFNYTDTFERVYNSSAFKSEICYIHGKSNLDQSHENNMVLGIDEYLRNEEKNTNTEFIEFKKFFQRIYKRTGSEYKKWLNEIKRFGHFNNVVYIFGHSLAITDKDILIEFLTCDYIQNVVIFYYDRVQLGQQITNLVRILGQEKMISMSYGDNPRIWFKNQNDTIENIDQMFEIYQDISIFKNFYHYGIDFVCERLQNFLKKLENKDALYFNNEKNTKKIYSIIRNILPNVWLEKNDLLLKQNFYSLPLNHLDYEYSYENADILKSLSFFLDSISYLESDSFEKLFEKLFSELQTNTQHIDLIWKCLEKISRKTNKQFVENYIHNRLKQYEGSTSNEDCIYKIFLEHFAKINHLFEKNYSI